ncbi:hypothetical protein F7Q91_03480 [Vibrio chagasii]|uniref:Uncharacterized protein n=1 Tax=Vibrio chagasii TaxID=170679 RepID=A0A7V7NX27_9VIBR|nr:hypothetical protein [Vibrio chagasii]KAB0482484.1 hypothetical protein F7Q91_03480 [Vibrio chagasii]
MNRNITKPQNIAEQIRSTLQGTVFAKEKARGKTQLREFSFPFGKYPKDVSTSPFLSDYVNSTGKGDELVTREWAETRWATSIALAIHYISGHEVYSAKPMKELRAARAVLNKAPWKTDQHRLALENFHRVWQTRFDPNHNSEAILNKTYEAQANLLNEFIDNAVQLGCVDSDTLFRLEPLIKESITAFNNGAKERELVKANTDSVRRVLYELMLTDTYQSNSQSAPHLAERMLKTHLPELQQFADAQRYAGAKKTLDFDINIGAYVDGANISINGSKVGGIADKFHNSSDKRSEWTVSAGFKQFDDTGYVALTSKISLVGRDSSDITFKPDFRGWLEMLPHSPSGTEAALTTEKAKIAYTEKRNALNEQIEQSIQESEKKHAERLLRLKKEAEERQVKVNKLIDQNYDLQIVTKDSAKGTQLEKKHITELLEFPELHGLFRHSSLHDIPAVSIQMGLDTENTRGLQFLANPPYQWGKEDKTNKMFEVMSDDMKNNFVQLGDVSGNSTIITAEGVATAGSLYIAAKRKNLDVVVVASMFAFNIKYAVEHYSKTYPNNPLINAADNDCWNKVPNESGSHDLRSINDNAGVRVAMELYDQYGVTSFGPDWQDESIVNEASRLKTTDFNDYFEIYSYEEALTYIGNVIEKEINRNPLPLNQVTPSQQYVNSLPGDFENVFEVYGLDANLQTAAFVDHDFNPKGSPVQTQETEQLVKEEQKPIPNETKAPLKTVTGYEVQRLNDGEWTSIETSNSPEDILLKQNTEKQYAIEDAYANLVETGTPADVAFSKSVAFVESTYRCLDLENKKPFTSAQTFNDAKDLKLEKPVVLLIENENGKFTRPIRIDSDGSFIIGGKKTNEQPTFIGRNEISSTIKSVLNELYFNEKGSYDWVTEEHFILRTIDENGKPDRESSRTFNTEFNCNVEDAQKELLSTENIDVKFLNEVELVGLTCSTTDEKQPIKTVQVNKNELAYEVDKLKKNPSIIDIDTGSVTAGDLSFNITQNDDLKGSLTIKSYAPNGIVNGTYVLASHQEADEKIQSLNSSLVVVPTTLFINSKNGIVPLKTGLEPISIGLLPPATPEDDLQNTPVFGIQEYLSSLNQESIVGSLLPEFNTDKSMTLVNDTWYEYVPDMATPGDKLPTYLPQDTLSKLNDGVLALDEFENELDHDLDDFTPSTPNDAEFANNVNMALSGDEFPAFDLDEDELAYLDSNEPLNKPYSDMAQEGILDSMIFDSSNTIDPDIDAVLSDNIPQNEPSEGFVPDAEIETMLDSDLEIESDGIVEQLTLETDATQEEAIFDFEGLAERDFLFDDFDEDLDSALEDFTGDLDSPDLEEQQSNIEKITPTNYEVEVELSNQIDLTSLAEENSHEKEPQESSTLDRIKTSAVKHASNLASIMKGVRILDAKDKAIDQPRNNAISLDATETQQSAPEKNTNEEVSISETTQIETTQPLEEPKNYELGNEAVPHSSEAQTVEKETRSDNQANSLSLVSEILKQLTNNPVKYEKSFDVTGEWATANTVLNLKGGVSVDSNNYSVQNELNIAPNKIVKTDVNRPSKENLRSILERSKLKAWGKKVTDNSIQSQVEFFAEQSEAIEQRATKAVNDTTAEIDLNSPSGEVIEPNTSIASEVNQPIEKQSNADINVEQHETSTSQNSDITEQLELLLELLKSGDLGKSELSNLLNNYSKVEERVEAKTPSNNRNETPQNTNATATKHTNTDLSTEQAATVSSSAHVQDKEISDFWEFEYDTSTKASDFLEKAEELVGDKGKSAVLKKAAFLMTASEDPNADINSLAQNAISIMVEMEGPKSDLQKQEYASKAKDIANWLDSTAKVGLLIESTRNDAGYVDKFSTLPQNIKDKIHEYLVNPVNEVKKTEEPIFKSWMCIKDSIEKRQIPVETMKQAIIGAWNIQPRQGVHASEYSSANGKLRKGIDKFIKKATDAGLIYPCPTDNSAWSYIDPIDKSEKTITKSDFKFKTAAMVAAAEVQSAIDIPRNAKKWARQDIAIQAGQVFEELTSIPSPYGELREAKHSYMPAGRRLEGSKQHKDIMKETEVNLG